jgi:hypothetical protein
MDSNGPEESIVAEKGRGMWGLISGMWKLREETRYLEGRMFWLRRGK